MSVEVLASADFRARGLLSNLLGNPYPKAAIAGCEELAICYHPKPDEDLFILSMYKLEFVLRAVRIRAALLTRTEAESEKAESEGRSRTREWFSDGEHAEG